MRSIVSRRSSRPVTLAIERFSLLTHCLSLLQQHGQSHTPTLLSTASDVSIVSDDDDIPQVNESLPLTVRS